MSVGAPEQDKDNVYVISSVGTRGQFMYRAIYDHDEQKVYGTGSVHSGERVPRKLREGLDARQVLFFERVPPTFKDMQSRVWRRDPNGNAVLWFDPAAATPRLYIGKAKNGQFIATKTVFKDTGPVPAALLRGVDIESVARYKLPPAPSTSADEFALQLRKSRIPGGFTDLSA